MSKKLRIFLNSNSPWATSGYSNQIADLLPLIRDEGYPLAMTDFFGLEGGKLFIDGVLHYPKINHVYGSDALIHHANDFNADVCFTLQDIWVLNPVDLEKTKRFIPIVPVDHEPCPRIVLEKLKYAYRIVTYSKFGQKELQKHGYMSTYIPHTVDTDIFKPMDKIERKKLTKLPLDSYVVGMVAANKENPPRKSFQEALDAFKMFLGRVPKALMYIHTNPNFPGGFPIQEYANFIGIGDKMLFPDLYHMNFNVKKPEMNLIYNTFDVLLMPSISEGFGVPAIEAQAVGVPAIVNNWTSMPELVIKGKTGDYCELISKRFSGLGSYAGVPSTQSLFEAMLRVYQSDAGNMRKSARKWIIDNYDTKKVFRQSWAPYLAKLESEIYPIEKAQELPYNKTVDKSATAVLTEVTT